jgi:hypothetical protein
MANDESEQEQEQQQQQVIHHQRHRHNMTTMVALDLKPLYGQVY